MDGPIRAERWLTIAFVSAIAVHLAVVLALPYFVAADGAAHLGGAAAFWDSVFRGESIVSRYAFIQLLPATNLIPDLPAGLLAMAIGPQLAEKLLIGGFVVGLPAATAYAVRGVAPGRWWLAFLVIPLSFTFTLHYGFYPFCYGALGLVIVMGYVVRHRARWTWKATLVLAILLTGTYMAHVLPFGVALLFMGIVATVGWLTSEPRSLRASAAMWVRPCLAALPGIVLTCYLVVIGLLDERTELVLDGRGSVASGSASLASSVRDVLILLRSVLSLGLGVVTFENREYAVTAGLAALLLGMLLVALWRRARPIELRPEDAYLLFGVVVVIAIVVLPRNADFAAGGTHLGERLAPLPVIGLLLWLAAADLGDAPGRVLRRMPWLVAVVSIAAAAGLVGLRVPYYVANSQRAEAYVSVAPCLATEATMIQVNLGRVAGGISPFVADTGRLVSLRGGWDIGNIGAALPFFPLRNRPETDPYRYLVLPGGSIERIPPTIDPAGYNASTPGRVDYVLVYGRPLATGQTLTSASWQALSTQLDADYVLVATSHDSMLEVYESRDDPLASAGAAARAGAGDACRPAASARGFGER